MRKSFQKMLETDAALDSNFNLQFEDKNDIDEVFKTFDTDLPDTQKVSYGGR